ncbi:MAG TPA: hypothetical protein DEF51_36375 [Myxococcales bacterium]|nr:hypothetical protein [Myxococcales bacterium]
MRSHRRGRHGARGDGARGDGARGDGARGDGAGADGDGAERRGARGGHLRRAPGCGAAWQRPRTRGADR